MISIALPSPDAPLPAVTARHDRLFSQQLHRAVELTILLPPGYSAAAGRFPVLYLNDGQDMDRLGMTALLDSLYEKKSLPPLVVVGIHANQDRLNEYGTADQADYKGRGAKAGRYTQFVLSELMPFIEKSVRVDTGPAATVIAGFSLGGLSALDLAWSHPERFGKVGVFSGSLWWRKKAYEFGYDDHTDRIMHTLIRATAHQPALKFWFEAGTEDETSDRNKNGVIDAIDDTLDLMKELRVKGYRDEVDFEYVEVSGGKHNQETWAGVMPDFLHWAFPEKL
ncbi:MAG: esterase family protein [Sphingobacteriaceae bacterium]|nr:esterase family protein [Cytophagaceae bacterium]